MKEHGLPYYHTFYLQSYQKIEMKYFYSFPVNYERGRVELIVRRRGCSQRILCADHEAEIGIWEVIA